MNITHIVEASATGTLSMLALLANAQAKQNYQVEVIYSIRPETPENISSLFSPEVLLTNIQMYSLPEKIFSLLKIRSRLKETSPDKVIMHSSFAGFLGRLASLGSMRSISYFYIPHCISFMRKDIGTIKKLIFILFEWLAATKKADYIACSKSEKTEIIKYIPFRICHLVENAIDFDSNNTSTTKKTFSKTIITVGQIRHQKGPREFAEIAQKALSIDPSMRFLWVGDGDLSYKNQLEIAGVTVLGWMAKSAVLENLSKADIYLSTSKWEGMPVSLIEATYTGLPLIASGCAGNVDVIENGSTGWIYKSTNEAVERILDIVNNQTMAKAVAERALDVAKNRFSVDRYVNDMDNLMGLDNNCTTLQN